MIISENTFNNITVIALQGTLDARNAPQLKQFNSAGAAANSIVINLSEVDFLDSSGLGAIVSITRLKRSQGGDVILACMNDKVRNVFEITHVYKLFDIYDDVEAATLNAEKKQISL